MTWGAELGPAAKYELPGGPWGALVLVRDVISKGVLFGAVWQANTAAWSWMGSQTGWTDRTNGGGRPEWRLVAPELQRRNEQLTDSFTSFSVLE